MSLLEGGLSLGLTGLGVLTGARRTHQLDIDAIINKWRNMQTLTPEDYAFASGLYQTGAEKVAQRRSGGRAMAAASLAAKGLSRSPVSERLTQEAESEDAASLMGLERERQGTLFGIRQGREGLNLQYMLAEIAGKQYNMMRKDMARSGFMNSLLEAAPNVFQYFKGLGSGGSGIPQVDIAPPGPLNPPLPDAPPSEP